MYTPINGFTKAKIIQAIQEGNNGTVSKKPDEVTCAYRGANGNKCAVGCFIPDELYKDEMDGDTASGLAVRNLLDRFPDLLEYMPLAVDALEKMQSVHDDEVGVYGQDPRPRLIDWIKANVR